MIKLPCVLVYVCFICCFMLAWPLFAQETIVDAVQNLKIIGLEGTVDKHDKMLMVINEKMWWTQGGVAGIYALLGIMKLLEIKVSTPKV